MPRTTYFVRKCPTCGRRLQVRTEYMGRLVACQHCQAEFRATLGDGESTPEDSSALLLSRADELLAAAERSGILLASPSQPTK